MTNKFISRKLIFTVILLVIGFSVDFLTDRGLSVNLKELMVYLGGIYIFGNSASKAAEAMKERKQSDIQPLLIQVDQVLKQVDGSLQEIVKRVDGLDQNQTVLMNNIEISNRALNEIVSKFRKVG